MAHVARRCPRVLPWRSGVGPAPTLAPWSADSSGPFPGRPTPRVLPLRWLLPSTQAKQISLPVGEEKQRPDPRHFPRVILSGSRGLRLRGRERREEATSHLPAKTRARVAVSPAGQGKESHVNHPEEKKYRSVLENTLLPHFAPRLDLKKKKKKRATRDDYDSGQNKSKLRYKKIFKCIMCGAQSRTGFAHCSVKPR